MDRTCFLFLLCVTLVLAPCYVASSGNAIVSNITTDQSALMALKAHISHDSHNILTNNWSTNVSVCSWVGVICGSKHYRVTALNLSYLGLEGTIPPHVGNLSFLVRLSITNNSFHGSVPNELANLHRLKLLNFGFNKFSEEIPSWIGLLFKLQYLFMNDNSFTGTIPPSLSNASSLQIVNLGYNQLSGTIPSFIFNMSSLLVIDLETNMLSGELSLDMFDNLPNLQMLQLSHNQFYGELPSTLFNCKHLQYLLLRGNNFTGRVSQKIGNLTTLMELDLKDNSLEGKVLWEIQNLTMLTALKLGNNNFEGAIPSEVGSLQNLEVFSIDYNDFAGSIPFEIFNISTIQVIEMTSNNLLGHLPSNMGLFLPNLQKLLLAGNNLSGTIPSSISNSSQLIGLEVANNSFSGLIPMTFGNLRLLEFLNLEFNYLTVESSGLSFFSTLSNCTYLRELGLAFNPFNIILDSSIGNLPTSLWRLSLDNCNFKGSIPRDIGNLRNLIMLSISNNELVGPIPMTMKRLSMLQGFYLRGTSISGSIPSDLCYLKNLVEFVLDDNELSGYIPMCMDNLTSLEILYLGFNKLTSTVPLSLWGLTYLLEVHLSSNSLTGSLPLEIGNMKVLRILDLSRNQLSGHIPITIGGLTDLVKLSLADNGLEGSIPESFGKLVSLESLDLANNNLSEEIPKSLEALAYLKYLNMSFNRLRGKIPTGGPFVNFSALSFLSNDALCGAPQLQVPPCKEGPPRPKKTTTPHILKYLLPSIGLTILVVILLLVWTRHQKRNAKFSIQADLSPLAAWRRISKHELLQATEGFSANKLLGKGSFGSVYHGTLSDGMVVAIKVFNLQIEGAFKSFDAECEVLRNIRHRNLIKIFSTCSSIDFRAFVLEYMPNGSLEKWLYSQNHSLNILQRLNIIIDVASALEYLHYGYSTSIVHCDLKPNNVLLDEDMVAHVADFGIAKLIGDEDSMMRTMTLATIGYMAPEYGSEGIVSTKGDVYSYGILLMETFTRKKPTDDMFSEGMSLKRWLEESVTLSLVDVIDVNLLRDERNYSAVEDCLSSIMELALGCCAESPEERVNTKDIAAKLNKIKLKFLKDIGGG